MFVAYPPCEGCQWLSFGQQSDQQSSPWLCSLVNQTERLFWRLGNLCRCFELISWLVCHHILICWDCWGKIITIKITNDLNYFSLCALNLFNTRLSQFELIYWNKLTFPRRSNLLRCTCTIGAAQWYVAHVLTNHTDWNYSLLCHFFQQIFRIDKIGLPKKVSDKKVMLLISGILL